MDGQGPLLMGEKPITVKTLDRSKGLKRSLGPPPRRWYTLRQ